MISVVLLMAGKGERMKQNINKILLPLGDKLVFEHSLDTFQSFGYEIVCVVSKDDTDVISKLPNNVKYTFGGATRQESVMNGLKECSGDYVLIHDSARPFISKNVISQISVASKEEAAVLVTSDVKDTIREKKNGKYETLVRANLLGASTPQCAPKQVFDYVFNKAFEDKFTSTDDISLIEKYLPSYPIIYIKGNEENFKITTPLDYELAKLIARKELI